MSTKAIEDKNMQIRLLRAKVALPKKYKYHSTVKERFPELSDNVIQNILKGLTANEEVTIYLESIADNFKNF